MQTEILPTMAYIGNVELAHATYGAALSLYLGRR